MHAEHLNIFIFLTGLLKLLLLFSLLLPRARFSVLVLSKFLRNVLMLFIKIQWCKIKAKSGKFMNFNSS